MGNEDGTPKDEKGTLGLLDGRRVLNPLLHEVVILGLTRSQNPNAVVKVARARAVRSVIAAFGYYNII